MSVSSKLQNDWPMFPLGKLCEINIGRTPSRNRPEYWGSGYPWLSIADMNQGRDLETTKENITDLAVRECNCQLVPVGTVLLSFKLSIGKVGIAHIPLFTNEAIAALPIRDSNKLSSDYLYWALQSIDLTCGLDRAAKGLTLNKAKLVNIEIPVPPLPEQRKIVDILNRAEALRAKSKTALAQLDELSQSIFLNLFGNPLENKMKWSLAQLGSLASVERGKFTPRPRNDPSYYGGKFPFIQTGDISNSSGRVRLWSQTLNEKGVRVSRSFPPGTVVIAIVGATIGITAILDIEVYCPDSVVGIQVHPDKASTEYIERVLRFWRPIFMSQAPETARANINLETLRPLKIPIPPLHLQQQFTQHVEAIERLKTVHRASLAELDELFSSLQYRAFRGEL